MTKQMPVVTDDRRQALIKFIEREKITCDEMDTRDFVEPEMEDFNRYVTVLEIALASLFGVVTPDLHHIPDAGKEIPKGWRLMPDEPTADMMKAMYQAQNMWPNAHCDNQRELEMSFARPRYIAALATAPEAPND